MKPNVDKFRQIFENSVSSFCRSQKMLQNGYLQAKIGADTAENEQHFALFRNAERVRKQFHSPSAILYVARADQNLANI